MKTSTIVLSILSGALFISTSVLGYLYTSANTKADGYLNFGKTCITSFVTAVDLTLCEEDYFLGNVNIAVCKNYKDSTASDMQWARGLGYNTTYNYIGK